jgi:hypothetical protein
MSAIAWSLFGTGVFVVLLGFWLGTRPGMDDTKTLPVMLFVAVGFAWLTMGALLAKREGEKH